MNAHVEPWLTADATPVHDARSSTEGGSLARIVLDGQGHTVTLTGAAAIFGDDAEEVTIRNFRFVAGPDKTPGVVIALSNSRRVRIEDCRFEIPGAGAISTGGILTDDVVIERCVFAPARRRFAVEGTGRHTIRNCRLAPPEGDAVRLLLPGASVLENNDFGNARIERVERP